MVVKLCRMLVRAQWGPGCPAAKLQPQQLKTYSESNVNEARAGILSSP